jgi:hypothetical protein
MTTVNNVLGKSTEVVMDGVCLKRWYTVKIIHGATTQIIYVIPILVMLAATEVVVDAFVF